MQVRILGGAQTDFARNIAREGKELSHLVEEVTLAALADASVDASAIETIHFGNAFGELFAGQGQLGAMPATVIPALWGKPASRHEAACASGSIAILAATSELEAGRYDVALVVGAEQQRNVGGEIAARHLGAAAWAGHEGQEARYLWPHMFSRLEDEYERRYGLDRAHLAAIAKKNFANAKKNPLAQTRRWSFTDASFEADDERNPIVEGRLRRHDCGQITDGAAAVILVSERWAREHGRLGAPKILGWGHRTAALSLDQKLAYSREAPYVLPHLHDAIGDAFRRAAIPDAFALDGIETHDCFTMTEYLAIDHFGLTKPGESHRAVEEPKVPINPSGGLIGLGHPVGATGIRMLNDVARQVSNRAGDMQIENARRMATLNIGGSATTVVSFVVGA